MTLRMVEGFDWIPSGATNTQYQQAFAAAGWYQEGSDVTTPTGGPPRFTGQSLLLNINSVPYGAMPYLQRSALNVSMTEGYVGLALNIDISNQLITKIALIDPVANLPQITVVLSPGGTVSACCGGPESPVNVIGTAVPGAYYNNVWFYMEIHLKVGTGGSGSLEVKINGVPIITATGVNTQATANATFGGLRLWQEQNSYATGKFYVDDVYMCDTAGSVNNGYLGNCRVITQFPASNGGTIQFTPHGASSNWQAANNLLMDDTSYNSAGTAGYEDLYGVAALLGSNNIKGVQIRGVYRQDDSTQVYAKNLVSSSGTLFQGANVGLSQSYAAQYDILETDPHTSAGWTAAAVNAMQIGPKVQSIG